MAEYIDRDAFIKHYRELLCKDCDKRKGMKNGKLKFCYKIGDAPCRACSVDDMFGYVEDFPVADLSNTKQGIWIKNQNSQSWKCSVCDKDDYYAYSFDACDIDPDYELQDYYCPNCGADMRGE